MELLNNDVDNILLVEDDESLRGLIRDILVTADYNVVCAKDGNIASSKLKNQKFSLVITDLNLPKKDGIKIANESISQDIPILLMTGELEEFELKLHSIKDAILLTKPFNVEVIPILVAKILNSIEVLASTQLISKL